MLIGTLAGPASATTSSFSLDMTSGSFAVQSATPSTLSAETAAITGSVDNDTGEITDATITVPDHTSTNSQGTATIKIYEVTPGSASGSINYLGDVSISDTFSMEVDPSGLGEECVSSPVDLNFVSTSPYTTTGGTVTVTATNFTIPDFSSSNCSLAAGTLDSEFSGSSGNELTLDLSGTLPIPPAPAATSTTALSVSPSSPQIQGTSVTLTASIASGGSPATTATGTVQFYNGSTPLGQPQTVSDGSASFATTALPGGTDSLTASYSGDPNFTESTSSSVTYIINPTPSVTVNAPASVTEGSAATAFSIVVANPSGGQDYQNLWLSLRLGPMLGQLASNVTLDYQDSAGNWCPITLANTVLNINITGTYEGSGTPPCGAASSFSLQAGQTLTLNFELSVADASTVKFGNEPITATLQTVDDGTVVAPLSGSIAPVGTATTVIAPVTPFTPTVGLTVGGSTPQNFSFLPRVTLSPPTTPSGLPSVTGSVSISVDGTTKGTYSNLSSIPAFSTEGLSVGDHTVVANYLGSAVYAPTSSASETLVVGSPVSGTLFSCVETYAGAQISGNAVLTATSDALPDYAVSGTSIPVTGLDVSVNLDGGVMFSPGTNGIGALTAGLSPGGSATNAALIETDANFTTTGDVDTGTFSGLATTTDVPVSGSVDSVVTIGLSDFTFTVGTSLGLNTIDCSTTTPISLGSVTITNPVTWTVDGCSSQSTTAPTWATTMTVEADGAGGGGGGAAASADGYGGTGGTGGAATSTFAITGGTTYTATTGCGGHGAPQGAGVVGNGGAAAGGWSGGGAGGQGTYCDNFFGSCGDNDGTGGSGGGSTGVCAGSSCTSSDVPLVVAAGGGGGGESMCKWTSAGAGGQAGNASSTTASDGAGNSGSAGGTGGTGGVAGGAGGINSAGGSAAGATGGHGGSGNYLGDSAGSGGGGGGYVGGAGGANNSNDADCGAGGGGGGGSSWVASAGTNTSFGTGAAGGGSDGSDGNDGSVNVTFS